ncbi:MAG: GNAT family N-acetyltransferase [Chitinophagales bacterium]
MNIIIRKAEPGDVAAIHALIRELAEYEKFPSAVVTTESTMMRDGFGSEKIFDALVSDLDGRIIGTAIYYTGYSTWKGRLIYLEDLVVLGEFRRSGIGKMLFDELINIAVNTSACQLRWQVLDWNTTAINFYKKYNASFENEWISCRLEKEELEKQYRNSMK